MGTARLSAAFARARDENRAAMVAYIMAGDPDLATTAKVLDALATAKVDIIELGFPFSDPMADGPAIQRAALRSLAQKTTLAKTLGVVADFRAKHADIGLIVMGYLNPVETMGYEAFAQNMAASGGDGAIIVDAPPEEDAPLRAAMGNAGLSLIRLATPTTDKARLPAVVEGVTGFVYYVSVAGITGDKSITTGDIAAEVEKVRAASGLPVAVGFGIKTPEAAAQTAKIADGVVVGSALVEHIEQAIANGTDGAAAALDFASALVEAVAHARPALAQTN